MSYISNIQDKLKQYKKLQFEINVLEKKISEKREEMYYLDKNSVVVRLGDLIKEISKLSGVPVTNIKVKIDTGIAYYGVHSQMELTKMRNSSNKHDEILDDNLLLISLSGKVLDGSEVFDYSSIVVPFDMDEIQADGKTMYEHMGVSVRINPLNGRKYTTYIVNKKIKNIIINIPIKDLTYNDHLGWYPANLFTEAVINCTVKSYKSRNQYVRSRVRR